MGILLIGKTQFISMNRIHNVIFDTTTPKLTSTHLKPSTYQKISVRLAAQVFRYTVASMYTTSYLNMYESQTFSNTAEFVLFINQFFNIFNRKSLGALKKLWETRFGKLRANNFFVISLVEILRAHFRL